jgi:hypothetical protein
MDREQSSWSDELDGGAVEEPEIVDGVVVVADVRALQSVREGPPPFVQVAAVAATGFMAGAATAAVLGRRLSRAQARRTAFAPTVQAPAPRQFPAHEVAASQRFLVDVYTLVRR